MAYEPKNVFNNPDFDRSEWEVFIAHPDMPGNGATFHYIGEEIETMEYTVNTESNERSTIASRLPRVTNKDGGITFPAAFQLTKGQPAYDAILSAGLLGLVNEEFDCIFLYGNIGVKEGGSLIPDAPFAQKARIKLTVTSLGGAGAGKITVTSEGRTSGDIERGYMKLEADGTPNYDPDARTWNASAFVKKSGFKVGDLVIGGAA